MHIISIRDYMKISPKGRAAGKRSTTYAVLAKSPKEAMEKAYRTHGRRMAQGDLTPGKRPGGWCQGREGTPADFMIL